MPGIGPSRNRQHEQAEVYGGAKIARYGEPGQPALPDIIPYPSSDAYKPYEVYNARDYRVYGRPISSQIGITTEQSNTLLMGLIVGIPLAILIWHGMKNKPRGY